MIKLYAKGVPVIIKAGALLRDNRTDNNTRSFHIQVTEAVFEDKSIWSEEVQFEPAEYEDLFLCACGKQATASEARPEF